MRHRTQKFIRVEFAALAAVCAVALAAAAFAAEYQMTVNRDRLVNAQNEPHNWLLMNGDYGATRYSKLTQINRDNVRNLRLVWAMALGRMQDIVQNGAGDGGTRGWVAALEVRTGKELWRWYVVPKPGDPGSETWKDDHNAWKTGGGGIWQTGSYDPATRLYIVGTGNPFPIYDPQARPGDNLYTDSAVALNVDTGKPVWHFQYTPNDSWDYDEVGVHMLYDATINGEQRKIVGHFARNGFYYTLDRTNGKFIKADQYVNDLNWTKGINPKTGRPLDYDPKVDVQIYNPVARALRGDGKKRACPTWHGGVAHQPTAYHPVKKIAYGVGIEGCFTQNGAAVVFKSKDGDVDVKASEKREYSSDLYYGSVTAYDTTRHKVIAKAITA